MLTNGILREAVYLLFARDEDKYPSILVAANGGFYDVYRHHYVPAYSLLRRAGKHLKSRLVVNPRTISSSGQTDEEVAAILDLDVSLRTR